MSQSGEREGINASIMAQSISIWPTRKVLIILVGDIDFDDFVPDRIKPPKFLVLNSIVERDVRLEALYPEQSKFSFISLRLIIIYSFGRGLTTPFHWTKILFLGSID